MQNLGRVLTKQLTPFGLLLLMGSVPAIAGTIDPGTPFVSGYSIVGRQEGTRVDLSIGELQQWSLWLNSSKTKWQGEITEAPPNEDVQLQLKMKHTDGSSTSIAVIRSIRGGRYCRLTGPGTWAYRSFASLYKTGAATRRISDQEFAELQKIDSRLQ